ncbi:MAG: molybdopterin oxidoreductase family protein, partial [Chloroflexota bacterium]
MPRVSGMAISTTATEAGGGAGQSPVTRTHCPYCAFQCGMTLTASAGDAPIVSGDNDFPVNHGALCVKGWTSAELLRHPDRLTTPLGRTPEGKLAPVSWDEALGRVVEGIQQAQERYGRDSVAVFGGGSLTNEKAYLLGKFARVALRTPNVDYNGRYCMSSAAAAGIRALGIDRGLPFPLEDIRRTEVVFLAGGNVAETMPPIMQYFEAQRNNGGQLIVADPRRTATAARASLHLQLMPGTDAALANGILHVLVREGLLDERFIEEHTEGFGRVRAMVSAYWPERVEGITGVPHSDVVRAARMIGTAGSAM